MFNLYKRRSKKELKELSDDELKDEIHGNNNILDTFEEFGEENLSITERQLRDEISMEFYEHVYEYHKRKEK